MANVQDIKAQKAAKALRLFTVLLLALGVIAFVGSLIDLVTGHMLLKLFGVAKGAANTNFSGIGAANILMMVAGTLLIIGTVMHLVKKNYRVFQGTCIGAIIFSLFPFIIFAVNIGKYLFALIFALLALAIIVLAIFAMKSRWQVYIKEMTGEVKKLTWLSMKELIKATAVVLVFVLAFALLIYVLDLLFNWPIKALLTDNQPTTTQTTDEHTHEHTDEDTHEHTSDEEQAPADEGTENNG
jgi:preprotein translocase SecE subunit